MHTLAEDRYAKMAYRKAGNSGLKLPAVSLGAWETLGGYAADDEARTCILRGFDLGVTHFDFANGYGHPPGNAELVCSRVLKELPRDELIIATKAGFPMWQGPYGDGGSRKYPVASCDQSLERLGVDYVDVFYHHRMDPETPVAETIGALAHLVRSGKSLYVGVSNYTPARLREALAAAEAEGVPITLLQPYYNMIGRAFEAELAGVCEAAGVGVAGFAPLASGLLTDKHLDGDVPAGARGALWPGGWVRANDQAARARILSGLSEIAAARGQSLAQMAIAWNLRKPVVTTVVAGASRVVQLEANVAAIGNLAFAPEELAAIDALSAPPKAAA